MPSNVTDLLRKTTSLFSTTTTGSINDSVGTIPLNSVSGLPTDTAITATIDRVDSNGVATGRLERAICTISGSNLVDCVRGNDSTTAQTHPSGAVVEMVWNADQVNDLIDNILAGHDQLGSHTGTDLYATDGGANDTYAITLSPVPVAYATGMTVRFKANTVNTGACTINVNSLGAKDIRKGNNAVLADADIAAGSIVELVYDGTNFRIISVASTSSVSNTTAKARAFKSGAQNISTLAKINLDAESYDPGNNFDSTTDYRFTAPVTGYYHISAKLSIVNMAITKAFGLIIRKNNVDIFTNYSISTVSGQKIHIGISDIAFLTATDYIEMFSQTDDSARAISQDTSDTFLAVHLIST